MTKTRSADTVQRETVLGDHLVAQLVSEQRCVKRLPDDYDPGAFRAGLQFHTTDSGVLLGDRLHSAPIDTF